jgi:hypothetical protein
LIELAVCGKLTPVTYKDISFVKTRYRRTPKGYDGTGVTTHAMSALLPAVLAQIGEVYEHRPDLILAAWPEIIGKQLAGMTEAISFDDGVLVVKVKNSTLHSLLSQHDKNRVLNSLRQKFPNSVIKTVIFRMG